jgi:hypothetical protein
VAIGAKWLTFPVDPSCAWFDAASKSIPAAITVAIEPRHKTGADRRIGVFLFIMIVVLLVCC